MTTYIGDPSEAALTFFNSAKCLLYAASVGVGDGERTLRTEKCDLVTSVEANGRIYYGWDETFFIVLKAKSTCVKIFGQRIFERRRNDRRVEQ